MIKCPHKIEVILDSKFGIKYYVHKNNGESCNMLNRKTTTDVIAAMIIDEKTDNRILYAYYTSPIVKNIIIERLTIKEVNNNTILYLRKTLKENVKIIRKLYNDLYNVFGHNLYNNLTYLGFTGFEKNNSFRATIIRRKMTNIKSYDDNNKTSNLISTMKDKINKKMKFKNNLDDTFNKQENDYLFKEDEIRDLFK